MRSNSASEVCTSTLTRSSDTVGNSSRVCRVVNATIVPAVSVLPAPARNTPPIDSPATR